MKIIEINEFLKEEQPKIKGIIDKRTGKTYLKGENPFMDMQINNYIISVKSLQDAKKDWYGFIRDEYEIIFQ